MQLHIDRSVPVPISEQIKGQMAYAIRCGTLRSGDPLPSVRELSETLGVSLMTVARVYRDLAKDDLIITKPGAGSYVADILRVNGKHRHRAALDNLRQIADMYMRHALSLGHSIPEIRRQFLEHLETYEKNGDVRRIGLVGNFARATHMYAQDLEMMLHDLQVSVVPLLVSDLENDISSSLERLRHVSLVVTVPSRLQQVRMLLEPRAYHVVAVAFRPRPETQRSICSIDPDRRVGVVATYPQFLQSLLDEVASYSLVRSPILSAVLNQEEQIRHMLTQVDVVVYASGSERILEWVPQHVRAIEYQYQPEPDSVNRLRPLIAQMCLAQGQ